MTFLQQDPMRAPFWKARAFLFVQYISRERFSRKWGWVVLFAFCSAAFVPAFRACSHLLPSEVEQDSISSILFPYEASPDELPEPLPTTEQIERSEQVLVARGGGKTVVVGTHFVVKYGPAIDLEEGRTMMFVRKNTSVTVPRVYALFSDAKTKTNYIVMERIHGTSLEDEWASLHKFEKQKIALQIREHIHSLRQICSKIFCSIGNKPLRDGVFWTADETVNYAGPFMSESELNNAIVKVYKHSKDARIRRKAEYCERVLPLELHHHKSVFTHGDLQRKNIMIREKSIVLIDWETAGFYPEYWEYSRAYRAVRFQDDWESYLREILEPFPREYNMLRVVLDDLGR